MKTIILDSGHGGRDCGAVNSNLNVYEKSLNTLITDVVYNYLSNYECKIIKTKLSDTYLSLSERVNVANKNNADRFISIHCNSSTNKLAKGVECWVYNNDTNEKLGEDILHYISENRTNRGIKESKDFTVLKKTNCKSVIVECGFISNIEECKYIFNNINLIGEQISKGIVKNLKLKKKSKCFNCPYK